MHLYQARYPVMEYEIQSDIATICLRHSGRFPLLIQGALN